MRLGIGVLDILRLDGIGRRCVGKHAIEAFHIPLEAANLAPRGSKLNHAPCWLMATLVALERHADNPKVRLEIHVHTKFYRVVLTFERIT